MSGTASGGTFSGAPVAQRVVRALEGADAADAGSDHAADARGGVGHLVLPAGVGQRLGAGGQRQLGEPVGATGLLAREEVGGVEVRAGRLAVAHAGGAGTPALVQRARADAQRGDRSHSGDDDVPRHARATMRSTASPTVLISVTSASLRRMP